MSTTTTPSYQHVARDATDVYDIVILRSAERCGECHCRIRDKDENDPEQSANTVGTGNHPTEVLVRAGSGIIAHDVDVHDRYGAKKTYRPCTYCAECGRPSGTTDPDPTPLDTMLDRVPPLIEALNRRDIPTDAERIYASIRHLKTSDEWHNHDTDIWRTATALGVRAASAGDT